MFFRENYKAGGLDDEFMSFEKLYEEYVQWCEKNGKKRMSSYVFVKDIRNNVEITEKIGYDGTTAKRGLFIRAVDLADEISEDDAFDVAKRLLDEENKRTQQTIDEM
jgi:phage/plasmid-associated DNA primase